MGLGLEVGILADLKNNDEEGYENYKEEFDKINRLLVENGYEQHHEPEIMSDDDIFSCDMLGYIGLHHLRRYAANIALGFYDFDPIPYGADTDEDHIIKQYDFNYFKSIDQDEISVFQKLFGKKPIEIPPYSHLNIHSDAEGMYVPVDFANVVFCTDDILIDGGMVGSTQRLLSECMDLARHLELPLDMDLDDDELIEAVDNHPGAIDEPKWKRYAIESFSCLRLIKACEASIAKRSAIVFC